MISPHLQFHGNAVDVLLQIQELRLFAESVADFLQRAQAGPPRTPLVEEWAEHSEYLFSEPLPALLHSSLVVSVGSLLERETRGFAQALKAVLGLPLGLNDVSGSWPERFRKYTSHVAALSIPYSDEQWQDLLGLVEVRNCLVHNGASLRDFGRAAAVRSFAGRHGTPILSADNIEVNAATSTLAIDIADGFLSLIYDTALSRFPEDEKAQPGV